MATTELPATAGLCSPAAFQRESKFIPELDGLRAIAIGSVLLTHFWSYPAGHRILNSIAAFGWCGVDLFFVLSGYLITGTLLASRRDSYYYRNFYARRSLRIFPIYYLLLLIVFVVLPAIKPSEALMSLGSAWPAFLLYIGNFYLAFAGWQLFLLDITWSLSVEEQFYLLWPALVRKLTPRRLVTLCLLAIAGAPILRTSLILSGHSWRWAYMMTFCRADSLAMGALVAVISAYQLVGPSKLRRAALWSVSVLFPVISTLVLTNSIGRQSVFACTAGYSVLALFFTGLLVIALNPGQLARTILSSKPMTHVGKVSYGMYIYHPLCLMGTSIALERLHRPLSAWLFGRPAIGSSFARVLIISILTLLVANISFYCFERPFLRLKQRFA